jgi:hypothetical protein
MVPNAKMVEPDRDRQPKIFVGESYFLRLGGLEIGPYLSLRSEVDGGISPSHDRILEKIFA